MPVTEQLLRSVQRAITYDFIRASGPGGQNVNKVATAVQLRLDIASTALPAHAKERLLKLAGRRATRAGMLVIEARRYRSQEKNRAEALARLLTLIDRSLVRPKARARTKPTRAAKEKRLRTKRERGEIKKTRRDTTFE